jgi:hypothetical protein
MEPNKPSVNLHNCWDPLEEIWLGDVWPASFYDDLDPDIRESWYKITEMSKEDLNNIQRILESFGVKVRRPVIDEKNKQKYINPKTGKLYKPPITPRDLNGVIGNTIFFGEKYLESCWRPYLNEYSKDSEVNLHLHVSGASTVKLGRDILFDRWLGMDYHSGNVTDQKEVIKRIKLDYAWFKERLVPKFSGDYRIHYSTYGGHSDSCFMTVKPGLLLGTKYWEDYDTFFPGWERIMLTDPTYINDTKWNGQNNNRWFVPGVDNTTPQFSKYIEQFCEDWIGDYTETYFEVNNIMIDPNNMLCMGEHPTVFEAMKKKGVTCHVAPFRARTFWDGGLHCITLDIRRRGELTDMFPNRGPYGPKIKSTELGPKFDILMNEKPSGKNIYHIWADKKEGITDMEFYKGMKDFFQILVSEGLLESFRITRMKLGFRSIDALPEWHIMMEFQTMQQLDDCFARVQPQEGELEEKHQTFNKFATNVQHALYRDWPDGY